MTFLPKSIDYVQVPPVKIQGIKSDLVEFIAANIDWSGDGRWVEPFLGSGVVLFNIKPERALIADANKHIINLYQQIQSGEITGPVVREFLNKHGAELEEQGEDYYYEMRDRFNENHEPLFMLFLNRSCYNGMMRFNLSGGFNVPFCKKPERFRQAYVTRIVNQVEEVAKIMEGKRWEFKTWDWRDTLAETNGDDYIYLDPPYVGRNTGYIGEWGEEEAVELAETTQQLDAGYAMSMWSDNQYRENEHIDEYWSEHIIRTHSHFYHVGSTEDLRNEMNEALLIKNGAEAAKDTVAKIAGDDTHQATLDGVTEN